MRESIINRARRVRDRVRDTVHRRGRRSTHNSPEPGPSNSSDPLSPPSPTTSPEDEPSPAPTPSPKTKVTKETVRTSASTSNPSESTGFPPSTPHTRVGSSLSGGRPNSAPAGDSAHQARGDSFSTIEITTEIEVTSVGFSFIV